jgi:uncharacterized protein (TIGR03435 family)
MQQSLLADRFKLKTHYETKEMPMYELVPAKSGPKLSKAPSSVTTAAQFSIGNSMIRSKAMTMDVLTQILESRPEIGGRLIVNKTGLSGLYDLSLKWAPTTANVGGASTPDADGPSLFTAIEEQLGLKLVPTKGPGQVLVIDHIERPSEN